MPRNHKLEELFNLPSDDTDTPSLPAFDLQSLTEIDNAIDKIDTALPAVRDLSATDQEFDDLAHKASETFDDLMNLGMTVEARYASEIFSVASSMFGHALTAKQAKLNKKLKIVELQLRKARLDFEKERATRSPDEQIETAEGQILSRNDLLDRILYNNKNNES